MTERFTVVVCDDHPMFRAALVDVVKAMPELELVAETGDGRAALEAIRRLAPAVAVLDLTMSDGLSGEQVLAAVVRERLVTRVLVLTACADPRRAYDVLAAGARGFLEKGVMPDEAGRAMVAVARGEHVVSPGLQEAIVGQIRLRGTGAGPLLSVREDEVLRHIAEGRSAPEIARALQIAVSTVKTHQQGVYEKLGVSDRAAAVAEAMRRGLLE